MKKAMLLNSSLSAVISKMGHMDTLTIGDAGLPIPHGIERIDLAVSKGIPSFGSVLTAVLSELEVQRVIIASEMKEINPLLFEKIVAEFTNKGIEIVEVSHTQFKELTKTSVAVVRTGECKPYANIILESGVTF